MGRIRLINADKLYEQVAYAERIQKTDILKMIDDAPTVPCRIAMGARWIPDGEKYTGNRVHCSICGYDIDVRVKTNYCPACGSRMDGIPPEWEVKLP